MIYVFDTSSLRELQHFYPAIFRTIWPRLDALVQDGSLTSTREVLREIEVQSVSADVLSWCKTNAHIFTVPSSEELQFVAHILSVPHFQALIGKAAQLRGTPVADPFVIARAQHLGGTVVTQEKLKQNASKIPNVCDYFGIPFLSLEGFMAELSWSF